MKEYEDRGQRFLDVDVEEDCSNITVTCKETPVVLVRDSPEKTIVNVLTWSSKPIEILVNNRRVDP